jgi:hypothetical protein
MDQMLVPFPRIMSQTIHIPIMFPPSLVPHVNRWFHQEERFPFFNGQLRYLAAETIRLQSLHPVPEIPKNGPENDQFGELLLKSGELLYKEHIVVEDELDGYANTATEFLPIYEIASATDPLFSFLRFYIWLTTIIPPIPTNLLKFDLEAEFQKVFRSRLSPMPNSSRHLPCTLFRNGKPRRMTSPSMRRCVRAGSRKPAFQKLRLNRCLKQFPSRSTRCRSRKTRLDMAILSF